MKKIYLLPFVGLMLTSCGGVKDPNFNAMWDYLHDLPEHKSSVTSENLSYGISGGVKDKCVYFNYSHTDERKDRYTFGFGWWPKDGGISKLGITGVNVFDTNGFVDYIEISLKKTIPLSVLFIGKGSPSFTEDEFAEYFEMSGDRPEYSTKTLGEMNSALKLINDHCLSLSLPIYSM